MALALYRRYRPDTFDGVVGQDQVTVPLQRALDEGKLTHAYLFSGPRGCGKTSSARILARCVNCAQGPTSHPCGVCESCKDLATNGPGSIDVVEIDAASHNGVDDARELRERAGFAPARDRYKIFILDEAHMVTQQGFNALLKIVEEPPDHVMFIFATTEPEKVIGTIRSRTHHYPFRLVPPEIMGPYLEDICQKEGIKADPGVLKLTMRSGDGSVRDTLSVLDQLMAGSVDNRIDYQSAVALLGYTPDALISDAIDAVIDRDGAKLYADIEKVIIGGFDPRKFVEDLLSRVRDLLVLTLAGPSAQEVLKDEAAAGQEEELRRQSQALGLQRLTHIAQIVNDALTSMVGTTSPRTRLELLAAQLLVPEEVLSSQEPLKKQTAGKTDQDSAQPMGGYHRPQKYSNRVKQAHTHQQTANEPDHDNTSEINASGILDQPEEVQARWKTLVSSLPEDVQQYINTKRIPQVSAAQKAGHYRIILTFANPLSQHAFALGTAKQEVHGKAKISEIIQDKCQETFGGGVKAYPGSTTASGEKVTPISRLTEGERQKVKAQIAAMALAQSVEAAQTIDRAGTRTVPQSQSSQSAAEVRSSAGSTSAVRAGNPTLASAVSASGTQAKTRSDAQTAEQEGSGSDNEDNERESAASASESAPDSDPAPDSTHSLADFTESAEADPWDKPLASAPSVQSVQSKQVASGRVPPRVHPGVASHSPHTHRQTVSADDDGEEFSPSADSLPAAEDSQIDSQGPLSIEEVARMFDAKSVETKQEDGADSE